MAKRIQPLALSSQNYDRLRQPLPDVCCPPYEACQENRAGCMGVKGVYHRDNRADSPCYSAAMRPPSDRAETRRGCARNRCAASPAR
jgi:hypothetical protein